MLILAKTDAAHSETNKQTNGNEIDKSWTCRVIAPLTDNTLLRETPNPDCRVRILLHPKLLESAFEKPSVIRPCFTNVSVTQLSLSPSVV